jgi:phosphate transport system substrate-binding protein
MMSMSRQALWSLVWLAAAAIAGGCSSEPGPPETAFPCAAPAPRPEGLLVAGSGVNLPLAREIARRYEDAHPDARVVVSASIGTGGAVRALADGAIDIGLASRELRGKELDLGLVEAPLARVPLVVATHRSVEIEGITTTELIAIYSGARTRWPDGTPIVPLVREPGDSGRRVLSRVLPAIEELQAAAFRGGRFKVCYTETETSAALTAVPGAIGFLDQGLIRLQDLAVRAFPLPRDEAGADPARVDATRPLNLLTHGRPEGEIRRFVSFARSDAVSDILSEGGYLPPEG